MKLNRTDMIEHISAKIQAIHEHTTAVHAAIRCANPPPYAQNVGADQLITALYRLELEEWRRLFMWGLTLSVAEQARIKAAAHDRFLSDQRSASEWFAMCQSGQWLAADEEQFMEMARVAFAPKDAP